MLSTNLGFNGNAKEVMEFYGDVFGYEITENDIWLGENNQVAHGELKIYGNTLMFTDIEHQVQHSAGFSLSINLRVPLQTPFGHLFDKYSATSSTSPNGALHRVVVVSSYLNTYLQSDSNEFIDVPLTDEAELRERFSKMSVGAEILLPIGKVEWSECYGLLKDKFGVTWQFNLD